MRELREELGISTSTLDRITKFYKEQDFKGQLLKEFSTLYTTIFDGAIMLDQNELSGGRWFSLATVEKMMEDNPKDFPPGFVEAFNRYKINK